MARLITVDAVKVRQRIDASAGDADIEAAIEAASEAVLNYVRSSDPDWLDTFGDLLTDTDDDPIVPADVKQATHVLVGMLLRDPSGKDSNWDPGFLPPAVACWLVPYRLPTLA
jgi:hypothetical protein